LISVHKDIWKFRVLGVSMADDQI
jgi:hypothetical protein